jgi:ankyrin repeat protein
VDNLRLLVRRGAAVNRASRSGFTPLFFALKSSNPAAVLAILQLGGNPDHVANDGTSAVQLAVYQKQFDFVATQVEQGASLTAYDRNGNQLLHAAALANRPELVRLLLGKGADPNALTGPSLVQYRYEVNFTSAPFSMPARPPLLLAAQSGAAEVMALLLDAGADAGFRDEEGTNVVLAAATSGKLGALELALGISPDANTSTRSGQTALHLLMFADASGDTPAIMKLLADKGARSDIRNRSGQTPLDLIGDAQTGVKTAFAASFPTAAIVP